MRKLGLIIAAVVFTAGCAVGPDYRRPQLELPEQWPAHVLLDAEARQGWVQWWQRFGDPRLDRLVRRALDDNLSIRLQVQRIEESRARLGLAEANRLPSLGLQADVARERRSTALGTGQGGVGEAWAVSGALSYELDFWGRLAREREAAEALLDASVFSRDAVRLGVIADVVTAYVNLRGAQERLAIARRTLESRERSLALERLRYEAGESDALAFRQTAAELEATRSRVPLLRQQVLTLESALAILVGMSPGELLHDPGFGEGTLADLELPGGVPQILPSALLARRPDIRSAEAGLIAANAGIGAAQAARLPSLNLAGLLGSAAAASGDLFTGPARTWGLSASLFGPLFDFGRSRARVDTAEALAEQAETQYRIAVSAAFREVRDALVIYDTAAERIQAVERQLEAIRQARELAQIRYEEGLIGFIELLDAERALLDARLALSEARRDRLNATATLFKALGGGWSEQG
ncbi:efflux transporter outer membrane subunit [Alkalilimnicola sp. S0819]|uniref:efflux transporter outer membrane subunit n=1 Tax=Alkalilimnicola sp. S0819 TaxID=2613922 RepID=UPI0012628E3A|nr:efflux transporter outer membrane subunit [Alkalilimnicola sp. S0819]KAB7627937.1 efflux transporter outer membrane subunit [Alkalilimnicola sp. S0819]MPQ15575.1 efflux transporter outer membrane subunit [Alkalilimnicola sp. S0819]